jgi:hypothetical protein
MDISYLQLHYYALTFTLYLNIYSLKVKICPNNVIWINNLALKISNNIVFNESF